MRRTLCFVAALFSFASDVLAQSYSGTYVTDNQQGGKVVLAIKQNAQNQVAGTLTGNGNTFQVIAQVSPQGIYGTVSGSGAQLFILAERSGNELRVVLAEPGPNGQPNLNAARQLVMTRSGAAGPAAKAAPAAPAAGQQGGGAQDTQISQFLSGNAWCYQWYNQRSGASGKERVVFRPDGIAIKSTGGESYSSGYGGTYAGQSSGGNQGRWRVRNGQLELSQDGMNWGVQPLEVTRNSSGSPILKSAGKEYMVCR